MPNRRAVLVAAAGLPLAVAAQQRAALSDPLRVGVDRGLDDAGLVRALVRAFGFDTGIAVKTVPGTATRMLESLDLADVDVTLTDAPAEEKRLLDAGLAHDGRAVADAQFALVGPAPAKGRADEFVPAGERDIVAVLGRLHAAGAPFLSANDGSGAHLLEQALWRAAQLAPAAPWYRAAQGGGGAALLAEARAAGAWAVVERGLVAAQARAPHALRLEGDARLRVPVRVLRAFRGRHPAAKIFAEWIAGPKGRAAARRVGGFG